MVAGELASSFILGVLTPLTAVCVLPLYPGFISYLSSQLGVDESRKTYALFGVLVVVGVLTFMLMTGLIFSTILQASLTGVIGVISPVAFGLLGLMSIFMILGKSPQASLPSFNAPEFQNPLLNAFGFGFFFGGIVIPCNPGLIAAFFARSFLFQSSIVQMLNFAAFGLGIGLPLLVFSIGSANYSQKIIGFLKKHEEDVNRATGLMMLSISVYYLVFVFRVLG